jgi:hypothetical protein
MRKILPMTMVAGFLCLAINSNAEVTLFSDNLESGANGWTIAGSTDGVSSDGGLWHLSQRWSASTNTSWYYGQESTGTVGTNGWNYGSITTPSIDLTSVTNAVLSYAHLTRGDSCLPIDDDYVAVYVSTNNFETFTAVVEGLPNGWSLWGNAGAYEGPNVTVDLSQFAGQTIKIQFYVSFSQACEEHLDLSECPPTEGYYIDDITVVGNTVVPTP